MNGLNQHTDAEVKSIMFNIGFAGFLVGILISVTVFAIACDTQRARHKSIMDAFVKDAIANDAAIYEVEPKSGKVQFVWKTTKKPVDKPE